MPFELTMSKIVLSRILIVALFNLFLTTAQAQNSAGRSSSAVAPGQFSFGEPGLEFTIQVPPLWVVEEGTAGYAAVLKPSTKAPRLKLPGGMVADPTITIAASKKPIEFDNTSLEKNAAEIEDRFIKANGSGTNFQIFQKNIVEDLSSGRKGLLYYISFKTDAAEVAQAVLMTGHQGARYRITLSDHKVNFDRNLELYYPYMVSIAFQVPPSKDLLAGLSKDLLLWGVGVIVAGALVGLVARMRRSQRDEFSPVRRKRIPASQLSTAPSSQYDSASGALDFDESAHPKSEVPQILFDAQQQANKSNASDFVEPAFLESDLSSPPQSIPLSQVVDENSAPSALRQQWKIISKHEDEDADPEDSSKDKQRSS
ncbi:MAG: hypothetical protein FJY29_06285 [Betaproteobacteria bacterium]|nr:hypothetical protein [Betaproteobacteria bacterium]